MAPRLAILALALTALSAGCLDADEARTDDPAGADGLPSDAGSDGGSHGRSSVTSTQELGEAKGSTVAPSQYPFTVTVPAGGAKNVRWELSIETTSDSLLQRVEGPGCGSTGLLIVIGGSSTFGGPCDDLAPGEHGFTAVLDSPAVAFTAVVKGQVTTVTEW